jgi:hemerythrin
MLVDVKPMKIKKIQITNGVYWVSVEEADVYILCGCPADAVKHLKKRGLIESVEKNGVRCETGPNMILLADVLVQNGAFSNLTEFPVLQMLYLQGMILPRHPNNTGRKPMLIGSAEQLSAQLDYIYRGNYGLLTEEELQAAGFTAETAAEWMRIKRHFAFGRIVPADELLDTLTVADEFTEIRNGVSIKRLQFNKFEISYQSESVEVDLTLALGQSYEPPYQLGFHSLKREYFAVVHSGEGDGWDIHRPCMSSVLMFQGKIYLVDAGPNILATLNYLGISTNEIEGIFHTHAHDDHSAGLTTLLRTDHKIKYFASRAVRQATAKKLTALMGIKENYFADFFDVHELALDQWEQVDGLEVCAFLSPHPVETNAFLFRSRWEGGYQVYAHLADVISFDNLTKMEQAGAISEARSRQVKQYYLTPAQLKKIDIGGGAVHGQATDFIDDPSEKIVLAHISRPLTAEERGIGSSSAFGMTDVLIPAKRDYLADAAYRYLSFYFPHAPAHELAYLLNHPIEKRNAGTVLFRKGQAADQVYLLLTGTVNFTETLSQQAHQLPAASLIGFRAALRQEVVPTSYWAASNIHVLCIPAADYKAFVERNQLDEHLHRWEQRLSDLQQTWLFGEVVSFPILTKIAQSIQEVYLSIGETLRQTDRMVYLFLEGHAEWVGRKNELVMPHEFFGGEMPIIGRDYSRKRKLVAQTPCRLYAIPIEVAGEIPVVQWRLIETYEKRLLRVGNTRTTNLKKA